MSFYDVLRSFTVCHDREVIYVLPTAKKFALWAFGTIADRFSWGRWGSIGQYCFHLGWCLRSSSGWSVLANRDQSHDLQSPSQAGTGKGFSDGKIHHENYTNWVLQLWFSRQPSRLHQLSKYVPSSIFTELDGFPSVRCTLEELFTYLRSLVPNHEMQINLPCAPSGRNKGFAFVQLCEGLPLLLKALWKSSIPTRKSTRPVKLQPANVNYT